jgi:hypothetical protein
VAWQWLLSTAMATNALASGRGVGLVLLFGAMERGVEMEPSVCRQCRLPGVRQKSVTDRRQQNHSHKILLPDDDDDDDDDDGDGMHIVVIT